MKSYIADFGFSYILLLFSMQTGIDYYSLSCFVVVGKRAKINPMLLISIAKVESGLRKNAINKNLNGTYDIGIMQVNTFWSKRYNIPTNYLYYNCTNIYLGTFILKQCFDRFGYSWRGVDCYNKGMKAKHNSQYVLKVKKELTSFSSIFTQAFSSSKPHL